MADLRLAILMTRAALDPRLSDSVSRAMVALALDAYGTDVKPTAAEAATITRWIDAAAAGSARSAFLSPAVEAQYRADQARKGHVIQLPTSAAALGLAIARAGDRARRGD